MDYETDDMDMTEDTTEQHYLININLTSDEEEVDEDGDVAGHIGIGGFNTYVRGRLTPGQTVFIFIDHEGDLTEIEVAPEGKPEGVIFRLDGHHEIEKGEKVLVWYDGFSDTTTVIMLF